MKHVLILLLTLGSNLAIGQVSVKLGSDCNPKLNDREIAYFDSLFSSEKYDFQNKTIGFATPNILRFFGIIPMPPRFNDQLLPISKKRYFEELNTDGKKKKRSRLLILPDILKPVTKGFDAIVLLIPARKVKKINQKTYEKIAEVFGYRSLNYPDNVNMVGIDSSNSLTDEEVIFFNKIYQHDNAHCDFKNKNIAVVDYNSQRVERKIDYINRIKKHLEKDFLYPTDDLILLTEDEKEITAGIDAVILLPEKMYNRADLIKILKKRDK